MIIHLDYETRSKADLKEVGAHRYAIDPSTEILMAGVSENPPDAPVHLMTKYDYSPEVKDLISRADIIYAHNAPFEQAISWAQAQKFFGFEIPIEKWRCTGAMARKASLPWSLEKLALQLKLTEQKNTEGRRLIRLFCLPNKEGNFNDPKEFPEDWELFKEYCRQDVRTEKAVHHKLKAFELRDESLETFLFDLRLNQTGIPVNVPALKTASKIIKEEQERLTGEFLSHMGFNPTQRELFRRTVGLTDMTSETVEKAIGLGHPQKEILKIYQKLSYAAIKKVDTILDCVCPDGRVRGTLLYYGAGTGRWSGRLVQPQNFKKTPRELRGVTGEVFQALEKGISAEDLSLLYGEPLELIAAVIRQFITVSLDADYSAIEARIICWLADQKDVLEKWRKGEDLYKWMAGHVYGITPDKVDSDQREVGKRIILGAGYGMGAPKFQSSCLEQYGLDLSISLCEKAIQMFRSLCNEITNYWYYLDHNARMAIGQLGTTFGPFTFRSIGGIPFLIFKLRSGRNLVYPYAALETDAKEGRTNLTYWGQIAGQVSYGRVKLYGGKLAENETQATAADIMAHGAIIAEKAGYEIVTLIHDQALAIKRDGQSALQFGNCLATLPKWATGLPLKVEAKECKYYSK